MDRGIRPYASMAKTYNEMIEEETEQNYRSRQFVINPSLKQPHLFKNYTEMMYLYSGGEQKQQGEDVNAESVEYEDANIIPVIFPAIIATDLLDLFGDGEAASYTDHFFSLNSWTIEDASSGATYDVVCEINPASQLHMRVFQIV